MPKDIRLESFKYHFLRAIEDQNFLENREIFKFFETLEFKRFPKGVLVSWEKPISGTFEFPFADFTFYKRGDNEIAVTKQADANLIFNEDKVQAQNRENIYKAVLKVINEAGIQMQDKRDERLEAEESFHDNWAARELVDDIDVKLINEAVTAPEMRYIHRVLGNIDNQSILDVGCGLGEASVYFAMRGARVTASDLSGGMLKATEELAKFNNVKLSTHKSSAEGLGFADGTEFDVIYSGNLLHHVDIEKTLVEMRKILKPGGVLVTWDPLHYNPVINSYRKRATEVRTVDEHPLKWSDLKLFDKHFDRVDRKYFWLSSLLIFVFMALVQRRDPNKERYWKSVIKESGKWAPFYRPLAFFDTLVLFLIPPLRLLCWNVVVFSKKK